MGQQTLFKVRDLRKKDQYKIDDIYLNGYARIFGPTTIAVYNSLSRHAEFHTQEAFPSEELIAEEHGITARTVRLAIKKLKSANIIDIERNRNRGKWMSNAYYLIDKSEWKPPEEIKDLWLNQRKKTTKTRGNQRPIKDNKDIIKDNKDNTNKEFNELMDLFKKVNPTHYRLFDNTSQRAALDRMVKKWGIEKIKGAINTLPALIGRKYAPVITTPYQLEAKFGDLVAYVQKEKGRDNKIISI